MKNIIKGRLNSLSEPAYKAFLCPLIPTVDGATVLGVRTPALRKLAKELKGCVGIDEFLAELPHEYYEENGLHGFIISEICDFDECIFRIERFLPYIDNWGTCDSLRPACFKKNTERLMPYIRKWLASEHEYTVRFAIEVLMVYFLDEHFEPEYLELVANVRREEYYVKMMVAWYFATALAKQWERAIFYIENGALDTWTHNKAIQKSRESYRITPEQKEYLKTLKKNR